MKWADNKFCKCCQTESTEKRRGASLRRLERRNPLDAKCHEIVPNESEVVKNKNWKWQVGCVSCPKFDNK